jgi:hypothetical protein
MDTRVSAFYDKMQEGHVYDKTQNAVAMLKLTL